MPHGRTTAALVLAVFAPMLAAPPLGAASEPSNRAEVPEWSQWRGPNRDGIAPDTTWRTEGRPEPLWKANVGLGYSNVCLRGGRLITLGFNEDRQEDAIVCLDALSGRERWRYAYPSRAWDDMHEGGTLTTPVAEGNRVFVLSRLGTLHCLDLERGTLVWKRQVDKELEVSLGAFGLPASPLLLEDGLVLNVGKTLLLDKQTGETRWQTEDYGYSYAVPVDFTRRGRPTLAVFNAAGFVTVDLENGEAGVVFPWTSRYNVNCATPIPVDGKRVFISTGYDGKGCVMLDLTGDAPAALWQSKVMRNKMTGCVLREGHLYGFDDSMLKCVDLDGDEQWRERGLGIGTIVLSADGRMIVLSENGELIVADATPEGFQPRFRRTVFDEGKCWTTPVVSAGLIYCRNSKGDLVCLDHRPSAPERAAR